jgi:hypothetical protein
MVRWIPKVVEVTATASPDEAKSKDADVVHLKGGYRSAPIPGSHGTNFDDPHRATLSRRFR